MLSVIFSAEVMCFTLLEQEPRLGIVLCAVYYSHSWSDSIVIQFRLKTNHISHLPLKQFWKNAMIRVHVFLLFWLQDGSCGLSNIYVGFHLSLNTLYLLTPHPTQHSNTLQEKNNIIRVFCLPITQYSLHFHQSIINVRNYLIHVKIKIRDKGNYQGH